MVLLIGSGHNALTAAFYLAKAGLRPLVLEKRDVVGGAAVTEVIAPGFRSSLAHATGPLREAVVRDMGLGGRVEFVRPDPRLLALSQDGRALAFSADVARTAEAIRACSGAGAAGCADRGGAPERLGGFLPGIRALTPPSPSAPSSGELWEMLKAGRGFRALGRTD